MQLGTTPLHAAAKAGHIETVELLLKAGIFRDAKTKVDRTALQMAAEEGNTTIVQLLLDYGADVNSKDMLRMTALHWAVERGNPATVAALLAKGADIYAANKFDKTPVDIAQDHGRLDLVHQLEVTYIFYSIMKMKHISIKQFILQASAQQRLKEASQLEIIAKSGERLACESQQQSRSVKAHIESSRNTTNGTQKWSRTSPEEDALEKLTAGTRNPFLK